MPIPDKYLADFEEGNVYHIYNRTNNKEKLFLSDENRHFFLKRFHVILSPFLDTFCWNLLPNHFHFLVRVKPATAIFEYLEEKDPKYLTGTEKKFLDIKVSLGELIEQTFKRFFQSYALAFNKMHNRKGNLFYKPFKRVLIETESHFTMAIIYIHANPLKHLLVKDFTRYKWSSWKILLSEDTTWLLREEVIEWFGSKKIFIKTHFDLVQHYYENDISIEELKE
ncbi:MAG: hypothetical protein ABIR30_11985 [Chitinophagaceae bacterium]